MFQACQAEGCHLLLQCNLGNISRSTMQTLNPTCNSHLFGREKRSQFLCTFTQRFTLWHMRLYLLCVFFFFSFHKPGSCCVKLFITHNESTSRATPWQPLDVDSSRGCHGICQCTAHSMLKSHNLCLHPEATGKFKSWSNPDTCCHCRPSILPLPTLLVLCLTRMPLLASHSSKSSHKSLVIVARPCYHATQVLCKCAYVNVLHHGCCSR